MDDNAKKWIAVGCVVSLLAICCVCGGLMVAFGGFGAMQVQEVNGATERFFADIRSKDYAGARALTSERFQHAVSAEDFARAVEASTPLATHTHAGLDSYFSGEDGRMVGGPLETPTGTSRFQLLFVNVRNRWVIDAISIDDRPLHEAAVPQAPADEPEAPANEPAPEAPANEPAPEAPVKEPPSAP